MIISYLGQAFVKVQLGDTVVAFNPVSKDFDPKAAKFGADLAIISLNTPAYNGRDSVTFGNKVPFVIDGPGEYEISGIFIQGLPSVGAAGKINTAYAVNLDNTNLCHLGALADANLSSEAIEALGVIDILFVPIGGDTLSPKEAFKLATSLEPKMIIPLPCDKNSMEVLTAFLKEAGEQVTPVEKLTIKRKDLDGKEAEIVVLAEAN